jgi:hypothetical protein
MLTVDAQALINISKTALSNICNGLFINKLAVYLYNGRLQDRNQRQI